MVNIMGITQNVDTSILFDPFNTIIESLTLFINMILTQIWNSIVSFFDLSYAYTFILLLIFMVFGLLFVYKAGAFR